MSAADLPIALAHAERWLTGLAKTGPDLRTNAHLKLVAEAQEFAENPTLEEAADVLICLVGGAITQGWTLGNLADAVEAKVIVNEARTWEQQADGTWQHTSTPTCTCTPTPPEMWTTHYGAIEPGSTIKWNPECPEHGDPTPNTRNGETP